jgi:hypothetical protein
MEVLKMKVWRNCYADPVVQCVEPPRLAPSYHRDLRHWVTSEAVAKASGASLLDVLAAPSIDEWILLDDPWFTRIFTISDSFITSVATSEGIPRLSVIWLTLHAIRDRLA